MIQTSMLQSSIVGQFSANEKRKVVLIADEPSLRSLISTFLVTMGWACAAVSCAAMDATLARESFDAVLLDGDHSGTDTETILLRIKQSRPNLSTKIVVIRSGLTPPETIELIERHNLGQVSHENLLQQLWAALQDLFTPTPKLAPPGMQSAQVVFDSSRERMPIGLRGSLGNTRQLAYQHRNATIDLLVEPREDSGRISITGQILHNPKRKNEGDGLAVVLVSRMRTMARTRTNQFGEFHLECEPVREACVEMRLREGTWVSLPLGELDWPARSIAVNPVQAESARENATQPDMKRGESLE